MAPLAFQGTANDAGGLMIDITSTVVTVIALVLGLTVVALQLSSTQFSTRPTPHSPDAVASASSASLNQPGVVPTSLVKGGGARR